MEELLHNDQIQNMVWDKLFLRRLFEGIWFPEGRTHEDVAVMYRLFQRGERVVCLPDVLYHYFQRPGSIVNDTSLRHRLDHYAVARERCDQLSQDWPRFKGLLEARCLVAVVSVWAGYLSAPREERKKCISQLEEMAAFSAQHRQEAKEYLNFGLAGWVILWLTRHNSWWAFALAHCVGKYYQRKHGRAL